MLGMLLRASEPNSLALACLLLQGLPCCPCCSSGSRAVGGAVAIGAASPGSGGSGCEKTCCLKATGLVLPEKSASCRVVSWEGLPAP